MTDVHTALQAFWSGVSAGVPAFVRGHVPVGTEFPYITYEVVNGDAMTATVSSAICYVNGANTGYATANATRAEIMDDIADAIPVSGVKVPLTNGYLIIRRNSSWQSHYDDPNDPDVIGGRTAYEIEFKTI